MFTFIFEREPITVCKCLVFPYLVFPYSWLRHLEWKINNNGCDVLKDVFLIDPQVTQA